MFSEIEAIAALGASISLDYHPESYYSPNEKWSLSLQLAQDGAGIRVEFKASTMAACILQAIERFHQLRQKGFVAYSLALPKPANDDSEEQEELDDEDARSFSQEEEEDPS